MNELGNDTASAVFRLGTKFMEELFKLLKFIFESSERKVNREIKKAQMEEAKQKSSQLRREEKIEKRREIVSKKKGLIKYKQLMQCGEPVYPVGYQCSQKEIDRLNRLAKMEGIPFAILKNSVVHDRINEIEKELKQLKKDGINDENKEKIFHDICKRMFVRIIYDHEYKVIPITSEDMVIEITIDKRIVSVSEQEKLLLYQMKGDSLDIHREEFNKIEKKQMIAGNNDIQKNIYISVSMTLILNIYLHCLIYRMSWIRRKIRKTAEKLLKQ